MDSATLEAPVSLRRSHKCDDIDCGSAPPDEFHLMLLLKDARTIVMKERGKTT